MSHKKPVTYYVKRNDGELISRRDLQYDLLHHIFSNQQLAFTDPNPKTLRGDPKGTKVSFRDLYVNTLISSPRASKVLREKMLDTPDFASDFAKLALLANVGRINTTMAFFPEMKTAIRTYHPIASLQKTNGNLQDAPRIKNILKSCLLDGESKGGVPSTPVDILSRSRSGKIPPTSAVNLIFVMASHAAPLAQMHFENNFDFLDLFIPINISSSSRARAFLWLCYNYLESGTGAVNPFGESAHKIPPLVTLSEEEFAAENVDTEEELQWADKMTQHRREFQAKLEKGKDKMSIDGEADSVQGGGGDDVSTKAKVTASDAAKDRAATKATAKERKAASDKARRERQKKSKQQQFALSLGEPETKFAAQLQEPRESRTRRRQSPILQPTVQVPSQRTRTPSPARSYHRRHRSPHDPTNSVPSSRSRSAEQQQQQQQRSLATSNPYPQVSVSRKHSHRELTTTPASQRTMLQHAWYSAMNTDPLQDSDEEFTEDDRVDYLRRLHVLSFLKGGEVVNDDY